MESYEYENDLQEMQELQNAGFSLREIADEMGISKSKVHRILQEAKAFDTSQDDIEPSQKDKKVSQTLSQKDKKPSQNVSQTLEGTEKDSENSVLVLNKEQKRQSYKLKENLEDLIREFLSSPLHTSDELEDFIDGFSTLKTDIEDLIYEVKDNVDDDDWFYPNELYMFLVWLKEAKQKIDTRSYEDLKLDREYNFMRKKYNEYDEENEEMYDEGFVVVDLFTFKPSKKDRFTILLKQDMKGIV